MMARIQIIEAMARIQIIEAAMCLFADRGYQATTIADIAAQEQRRAMEQRPDQVIARLDSLERR